MCHFKTCHKERVKVFILNKSFVLFYKGSRNNRDISEVRDDIAYFGICIKAF